MTTNAYLQDPTPVGTDGNLRFLFVELSRLEKFQNFAYVAAAVMIGIVVGVVFAAATGQAPSPAGPRMATVANSPSHTVNAYASLPAVQASTIQTPADNPPTAHPPASSSSPSTPAVKPADTKITLSGRHHGYTVFAPQNRVHLSSAASFQRSSSPPIQTPVPAFLPPSGPVAAFTFIVEGDLTVADFDVSTGTVETQEGKNFVLGSASSESSAAFWQDYTGNIHYRCDQSGNCTLFRHGIVVPNARRAI
jgi:hypothetical protein